MTKKNLNETAGGGAVGAGGIATRIDGPGISGNQRRRLQDFLRSFNKRVVNKFKYHPVTPFPIKVSEAFDLEDVLSRLSGIEAKKINPVDNVTYGIEDDQGNVMKVTVRRDQAAEFETVLAHELAAIDAFSVTGKEGKDVSMAELLFNLKDKFDIIDVAFPKIPTDVVYNADQATYNVGEPNPSNDIVGDEQTNLDAPPMEDDLGDVASGNDPLNLNDLGDDEEGLDDLDGDLGGELPPPEGDAEGVEDFQEPAQDEGSILDKVLDMLKAQAEAQTAQAQAEAEKYRAEQAEYSARAAQATVAQAEEMARMEAQMQKQKEQQAQAKKLADIAKFRVQQASCMAVNEGDEGETTAIVRKLMATLSTKWQINPEDSPETRTYKQRQHANEMRELQARMRTARTREIYLADQQKKQGQQPQDNQQQNQNPNQNNQQGQQQGQQGQQQNANQ